MSKIQILVTGGTLDKDYNTLNGELGFSHTHLPQMLEQANLTLPISVETLLLKDSLEMSDSDRTLISQYVQNSAEEKIVITHGTDTMALSANHLLDSLKNTDRTIVFTGAMRPYCLGKSDALFNLGFAICAAQTLPAGVYLAMNGQIHPAGKVIKNLELGVFETK